MSSMSQYLITVVIDGVPTGAWDTFPDVVTTAEINKRRPGGTPNQKLTAARATHGDATLGRENELERDWAVLNGLRGRVGKAIVVITKQPLDEGDVPQGKPTTYTGRLSSLALGDYDSNSDEPSMAEIVVAISAVS